MTAAEDGLRAALAEALARHADTMRRRFPADAAEPATVELGCRCGHERGTVTAAEHAATYRESLRAHREHVADAILADPTVRAAMDQQAAEELDAAALDLNRGGSVPPWELYRRASLLRDRAAGQQGPE